MSFLRSAALKQAGAALLGILLLGPWLPPAAASPAGASAGAGGGQIPVLCVQIEPGTGGGRRPSEKTVAVFTSPPSRRVLTSLGTVFWSGDHRRVLALGGLSQPATVRAYDAARGRFGPPVEAARALAGPGVRYVFPIRDIVRSNAVDWSRDGRTLCFYQAKTGLVLFDLRRGTRRVLRNPFLARNPVSALAVSPDGSRIAFSVEGRDEFNADFFQDLWLIGSDGRGMHRLGHGAFPGWSPQGRSLLATDGSDQDGRAIFRYDTRTGAHQVLRAIPETADGDGYFGQARYSPDGQRIVVFGPPNPKAPNETGLFLISARGTLLRMLVAPEQFAGSAPPICLSW